MSALLRSIAPRLAVFAFAVVAGALLATIAGALLAGRTPVSSATVSPSIVAAGAPGAPDSPEGAVLPVAFSVVTGDGSPQSVATLPAADLASAADALLGGEPVAFVNPSGFPRVAPVTQFDGGPLANANCTMASGAMLARLGFGIVTTGSVLRSLQDDQEGGTGLDDLAVALRRGFGVNLPAGLLRPESFRRLIGAGFGAVIQGDYSRIPPQLRLQPSFDGAHAVYIDGFYPGDAARGIPEAYYVIDPLGRPHAGYEGEWWPASIVEDFATAFGRGRIAAMWAPPAGGAVPPDVVDPDVLPLPVSPSGPGATPEPGTTPAEPLPEPGDAEPEVPPVAPPLDGGASIGGVRILPGLAVCLSIPPPDGCPSGLRGTYDGRAGDGPPPDDPAATIAVQFVDADRANAVLVGFTVSPAMPATVRYWEATGAIPGVRSASVVRDVELSTGPVTVALLEVAAQTEYQFQVVAGDGDTTVLGPVGRFRTGGGVVRFDVTLSEVTAPRIGLEDALSPYRRLAADAFAFPILPVDLLASACGSTATFGSRLYCVDLGASAPPPERCVRAEVAWALAGVEGTGVLLRAFPRETAVGPDGRLVLDGVIEAAGPLAAGTASLGCLSPGLAYVVAIDAVGDAAGVLAWRIVSVP